MKGVSALMFVLLLGIPSAEAFRVLVYTKSVRSKHASIPDGVAMVRRLAIQNGFEVDASENPEDFHDANLSRYDVIMFLNTGGNVLNGTQQGALVRYIRNGGGWAGVHAAAVTETGWDWYKGLIGAIFDNHPAQQRATIVVESHDHPSTAHLPETWRRWDEWYSFRSNPRSDVTVLLTLDESTYSGGTMGDDHPIAWYHEYDGGRSWYTALGHLPAAYREPLFEQHVLGGILSVAGATERPPMVRSKTVLPAGSEWKFCDRGEDLGEDWSGPSYDDGHWPSGRGPLGFGVASPLNTAVDAGPADNRHPTTYFRHRFHLESIPLLTGLTLQLLRDDGAVVYLNGTEIARDNMPSGAVAFDSLAPTPIESPHRFLPIDVSDSLDLLRVGENVLAVEVHQATATDPDLAFDLALVTESVIPPTLEFTAVSPDLFEISWPSAYTATYRATLEQSESLGAWQPVTDQIIVQDDRASFTVERGNEAFFRLRYRLPVD